MHSLLSTVMSLVAAAEAHAAESSGGIGAIGIDGKALLFQIINFAILLFILKKVAYKPILKVLEDRRKAIEESVQTAKAIERANQETSERTEKLLAKARAEADEIAATAQKQATQQLAAADARGRQRVEQLVADARVQIGEEVKQAKSELKKETMGLVITATAAIIEERLDPAKDARLLEKALSKEAKHE